MMTLRYQSVNNFFDELLNDIVCHQDTRAYIVGIYDKYKSANFDLSKDSITLRLAQGQEKQDFFTYQNLGDWIFFTNTVAPQFFQNASESYYNSIAQLSYYSCYRLINRQWKLFEELADNLLILEKQVKQKLSVLHLGK